MSVKEGQPALFECGVEGDMSASMRFEWEEFITKAQGASLYKNDGENADWGNTNQQRYEIQDTFNLRISNAGYGDGGLYACSLFVEDNSHEAHLFVLGQSLVIVFY